MLADLLQPSVRFPVQQVTETVPIEVNHVYVIPPNANLSAIDTHLRLSRLEAKRRERSPIDHFFRTLAATHDGHSIGIVLTGTGSDGTLGLKEIKAKGGVILVQDPNEAEFDGMPQSAIATGIVDRVLPIAELAEALLRLVAVGSRIPAQESVDPPPPTEQTLLPKILAILRTRTDRDFSRYKPATILRRISRRMQLNYVDDFARYVELLREQPEEARALADDLLITVTSFFRDPEVFKRLERDIIPHLFEGKGAADTLRAWSVGCATGEEAYSIAMLLLEEASRMSDPPRIQIFASDLHKNSLDGAREGLYPEEIEGDVSAERLDRFFRKENGGYRISKELRDTVVFAPHNLLGDPPFSRMDLITCRNLLIYLDRGVQRDVIGLFHYALCPNGYLLLGSAETTDAAELFRTEDKKLCLYQKRNVAVPEPRLPVFPLTRLRLSPDGTGAKGENGSVSVPLQAVHGNLLEKYAPPSILVGPENNLARLSERAGRYLIHPGGEVTTSALRLIREELRVELQSLLQLAKEKRIALSSRTITLRLDGEDTPVVMHVRPAQDKDQDGFVLVIFEEQLATRRQERAQADATADGKPGPESQAELDAVRQRLQAIIEEYETSQEEMKAANEEMQSTNEELRSTMEELETSKEQLQSINEELQTVNQENRHKVDELSQLSSDLQNLLSATDIATLFLDRDLRILRFTPRLSKLFNIRTTDRGRPISDLTHRLGYGQLSVDAQAVLDSLVPIEREIRDDEEHWYFVRLLPYRSAEERIEGVVITFFEISALKKAEQALRESESRFRALITAGNHPIYRMSPDWRLMYQLDGNHILADTVKPVDNWADNYLLAEDRPMIMAAIDQAIQNRSVFELEQRVWLANGSVGWVLSRAVPIFGPNDEIVEWFGSTVDITIRKKAEDALRVSEARKTFLLKLSDAFRNITSAVEIQGKACELLNEQLQVDRSYYLEVDEVAGTARVERDFVRNGATSIQGEYRIADFAWSIAILRRAESYAIVDTRSSKLVPAADRAASAALAIIACMGTPIIKNDRLLGALCVTLSQPRTWTEAEADLLREVSERIWEAVQRARVEARVREEEERQAFLLRLSDALRPVAEPVEIQNVAVRLLGTHLAVNRATFLEVMPDFDTLKAGPAFADGVGDMPAVIQLGDFGQLLSRQYRSGQTIVVDDVRSDLRFGVPVADAFESIQVRAVIGIPFLKEGRLVAILAVQQAVPRKWGKLDVALVEEVAQRVWAALERAQVEAALRESEENQRILLQGIPQLVWRSQDNGFWTWSSLQWQEFTGQSQEESHGRGWLGVLHPDDVEPTLQAWARAQAEGEMDVEHRIRNAETGLYRCYHTRSIPLHDSKGGIVEWLGTSTDIEGLKQAEAARRTLEGQFRLFVENVQEYGLVQTDDSGHVTHWNPGAERLFGYAAESMTGKDFATLLTREDQEAALLPHELEEVKKGHRNEDARWFVRKDGSRFWGRWITEPILNDAGQFLGMAKIIRDETERERAAAVTEGALAEKEELLKEVHHRVKNNLQVITSLLNLQANQIQDQQTLGHFDEARNRVASIASIHELLYRSGSMAAIRLADYARQFAPDLVEFYGAKDRVEIEVRGDGMTLELERAVPYGLLLNELLSNALKHAFPGERPGRIQITLDYQDDQTIQLCVLDDGIGMPTGVDVATANSLGLKLVHRLARQLKGSVEFRSSGNGTDVKVHFPKLSS